MRTRSTHVHMHAHIHTPHIYSHMYVPPIHIHTRTHTLQTPHTYDTGNFCFPYQAELYYVA